MHEVKLMSWVRVLREAGAAEVHVRISSPPVHWPCFYGIDFGGSPRCAGGPRPRGGAQQLPEARLHMGRDPLEGLDVAREILAQQHPGLHRARADTGGSSHHGFTSGTTEFGRKLP